MNKPTRFYSKKQETRVAKVIDGKRTANSGATAFSKGDVRNKYFLVECKTKTTPSSSMSVKLDWLKKNEEEAFAMNKQYSAVAIDFGQNENYYIINEKTFLTLLNYIKEESENG